MEPYYQDSTVTIYHGNCLDVLPTLPPVDLIVTDPPYGARRPSAWRSEQERFSEVHGNGEVNAEWLAPACGRLADGGACYVFVCWDVLAAWAVPMGEVGLHVRSCIVWDKGVHGLADLQTCWAPQHEMVLFGAKGRHELRGKRPKDVIRVQRVSSNKLRHPYEKPVQLMGNLIAASSDHGGVVLDPFAGSGATLEAAKNHGRRAIGVEIDEEHCETAARRLQQGTLPLCV